MWRYLVLAVCYVLIAALPLLSQFGSNLEYEYALIVALSCLVAIPLVALVLPDRHLPMTAGQYDPMVALNIFWCFFIAPALLVLPGIYVYTSGQCPCSPSGFGFWMLFQAYPALILAHAGYQGILAARCRGTSRKRLALAYVFMAVVLVASVATELWFHPQKRLTHLLTGFLHGPIYDGWIPVDDGLVLARSAHLAVAGFLLLIAMWRGQYTLMAGAVLVFLVGTFLSVQARRYPSVHNGKRHLEQLLNSKVERTDFTLHYRNSRNRNKIPVKIRRLVRDTEFHLKELNAQLKVKPPHIHIYVYPNQDKKKLWFGGGSTDVTDVWTPSVHITADRWPHPTLRHELVHAVASEFGFYGLGFHPNMAFTEGLAVALAPTRHFLSIDERSAALMDSDRLPPLENLFSPAFWREAGGRAYTVAGSVIQFLIDQYGIAKVKELYAGGSFSSVFETDRHQVLKKWQAHVKKDFDEQRSKLYSEALYRYPGVLRDRCPHSKYDLAKNRSYNVYVRLRQPLGWDPRTDYNKWKLALEPDNMGTRFSMWRGLIREVASESYPSRGRLWTWQEVLERARAWPPKKIEDIEMAMMESDLLRVLGQIDHSKTILEQLMVYGESHYLGNTLMRQIEARYLLEEEVELFGVGEWRRFLAGWRRRPAGDKMGSHWLITYLNLRNTSLSNWSGRELKELVTRPTAEMSEPFRLEWYAMLGDRLMRRGHYKDAAGAYKLATKFATLGGRDLLDEHRRRALYYAGQPPLAKMKFTN